MVSAIALVTGVSAVFVGSLLLRTWLRHGGASGTSHFRRIQILGHAAVGILGVVSQNCATPVIENADCPGLTAIYPGAEPTGAAQWCEARLASRGRPRCPTTGHVGFFRDGKPLDW